MQDGRNGSETADETPPKLQQVVQMQNDIGWGLVLEGWLSIE